MRNPAALVGISLLLTLAACAQPGQPSGPTGPDSQEEFQRRATQIAEDWRAAPASAAWHDGYVPVQEATILPTDPGFDDNTKQAFLAGWYRAESALPTERPGDGTIRFPDGTLDVPLISAAQAYEHLDQGDPPPCPGRPAAPDVPPPGPDGAVSSTQSACVPLTVTSAVLGEATVRTSRGAATVPAWLFTVAELDGPIARLAVDPSAVSTPPPAPSPNVPIADGLVAAQDLTDVEDATLTYRLGVGACDTGITPLVQESDDVVVVAGMVIRSTGICTDQLLLAPVTVTLDAPLGARPVLDAASGQPLLLTAVR